MTHVHRIRASISSRSSVPVSGGAVSPRKKQSRRRQRKLLVHNVIRINRLIFGRAISCPCGATTLSACATTLCGGPDYATGLISLTTGLKPTTLWIMHFTEIASGRAVSNS